MAIKHLPDGQDFFDTSKGGDHFAQMQDFGFGNSIDGYQKHTAAPPFAEDAPTTGPGGPVSEYARGGEVHHVHPHGHHVHHVEHHEDGSVVHHHTHGGRTVHHADGHVTHHDTHGAPVRHEDHMARGGEHHARHREHGHSAVMAHPMGHRPTHVSHHHDAEIHHHAHGGYTMHHHDGRVTHHHADGAPAHHMAHGGAARDSDWAEDKPMVDREVTKGIHQHEEHEHHGELTKLHLARGGRAMLPEGAGVHLPKPHKARAPRAPRHGSPLTENSALNREPRNPNFTRSTPNDMPGGQMGYGVQPSDEGGDGMDAGDGGTTMMRRGGRVHRGRSHK